MPSANGIAGLSGTPANLGKYTPKSSMWRYQVYLTIELADTDPLGVDQNIDFTAVGGLDDCTSFGTLSNIRCKSTKGNGHSSSFIS